MSSAGTLTPEARSWAKLGSARAGDGGVVLAGSIAAVAPATMLDPPLAGAVGVPDAVRAAAVSGAELRLARGAGSCAGSGAAADSLRPVASPFAVVARLGCSRVWDDDEASSRAAGTRAASERHQATASTTMPAASNPMQAVAQRGNRAWGAAKGTRARSGTASRCRSVSDLRSASSMKDTSVHPTQQRRTLQPEIAIDRYLGLGADDPVYDEMPFALIVAYGSLQLGVVKRRFRIGIRTPG